MQAVIDACSSGTIAATPVVVISNNKGSGALERAQLEGIAGYHLNSKTHSDPELLDREILATLRKHQVELIVLAGYMRKVGNTTLEAYRNRIVNIHPALLPRHGGQGMYGMRVHEAVLAAGEKETGVTVHLASDEYDEGPILAQSKVPVAAGDTPETLAARVLEEEHRLLVATIAGICSGEISLPE